MLADGRAQAFRLGDGHIGCLLLHGFTGSPEEMRPLGEALAGRGFTTIAPLLPGHGTRVEELARTGWQDWFDCALEAWDELGRTADPRVVAGLSMGSLLALHLARERPREVRALAVLAPALRLLNQRVAEHALWISRIPFLPRRFAIVPKQKGVPPERARSTANYDEIPLAALASMIRLQRIVAGELPEIAAPTLIVEGGLDRTIAPSAAVRLEAALGSERKSRIAFADSSHILTEGPEGPAVVDAVVGFLVKETNGVRGA